MPASISPPESYALHRGWAVAESPVVQFSHLARAWEFSRNRLSEIARALGSAALPPAVLTVGVAGSLSRMEATAASDCDLVVVLQPDVDPRSPDASAAFSAVWRALAPLQLGAPEQTGIYAGPVGVSQLLDPATIGVVSEDQRVFGSRILFLLELQPVWGDAEFRRLSRKIVDRYAARYVALDSSKQWTYLLNDLVRYFKSLCQTYMFAELYDDGRWRLRNLKARHSRLLIYVGLLFLLGEASTVTADKPGWLAERLKWTPLERLAACFANYGDERFEHVAGCLNQFVAAMSDPEFRTGLTGASNPDMPLAREANPQFLRLKQNGDQFIGEILRFALDRRGDWSSRFFEYWLF